MIPKQTGNGLKTTKFVARVRLEMAPCVLYVAESCMPNIQTRFFGEVEYDDQSLFRFPSGLPGFEEHRSFILLNRPGFEPLIFLQSLEARSLCFILLPIRAIEESFDLTLTEEEKAEIGLEPGQAPVAGENVLCAAMICAGEGDAPTANLMAPIVVNLRNNTGIQAIHPDSGYSHRYPLNLSAPAVAC